MSTKSTPRKLVRILITGLTVGSTQFKAGDIVDPSGMRDLERLADGQLLAGKRFAEWVEAGEAQGKPRQAMEEPAKPAPPEVFVTQPPLEEEEPEAQQADPAPAEEQATEPQAEPEPTPEPAEPIDYETAIKDLVRAGKTKTFIVKELGKPENVSQRAISDKFDELLALGTIVGENGVYTVEG